MARKRALRKAASEPGAARCEERWAEAFARAARERGTAYFEQGRAQLLAEGHDGVYALVSGSADYAVCIAWDGPDFDASASHCTCPAFDRFGPCKHMWAAILEIEASGLAPEGGELAEGAERERGARSGPDWRARVAGLKRAKMFETRDPWCELQSGAFELRYVVDVDETRGSETWVVHTMQRRRTQGGEWGALRDYVVGSRRSSQPEGELDRRVIALLQGVLSDAYYAYYESSRFGLGAALCSHLLPLLCETGRLDARRGEESVEGIAWDDGDPWRFELSRRTSEGEVCVTGELVRGGERIDLHAALLVHEFGFTLIGDRLARFDPGDATELVADLLAAGPIRAPSAEQPALLEELLPVAGHAARGLPGVVWSEPVTPTPRLHVESDSAVVPGRRLDCRVLFDYDGVPVEPEEPRELVVRGDGAVMARELAAERAALQQLLEAGARRTSIDAYEGRHATVTAKALPALVRSLLAVGWLVEADGLRWRSAGGASASIRSGVDWFELEGGLRFDDQVAPFPELLRAAREKRHVVELGDGTFGVLPERWLERWGWLELGEAEKDKVHFARQQGWILDALLAEARDVQVDRDYARFRDKLSGFRGVRPGTEPSGFVGTLRPYQRFALGWFGFLRELGLGGCLADDMGLGKTVQVLALLQSRLSERRGGAGAGQPSLVVAPRSLVFNWIDEAARFAPQLRVIDYTGTRRKDERERFDEADLIVTTFGTLRRDVLFLKERTFDYLIVDEAQAIKNAASQASKAVRVLAADHRLALSGTPIENHLGELWALLEFLNPGMLGRSSRFKALLAGKQAARDAGRLEELSRALRPFILRRTKQEVLDDLPEKTEQTLVVELGRAERRRYDELKQHYRSALLSKEAEAGIERIKIQVLEALLRLRQCACHVGLVDSALLESSSAKLDALLARLGEVCAEGSKALVFSQFTKLLGVVRQHLDRRGVTYEYLDGRTRKRKERVERFQNDPACPLFLVSLKAGGHGLNLTAADYVFLLDPWWNPAVEAQAIDRAHRIGRTRPVFAYRFIARDTVEEKVLELQREKRALADALLGGTGTNVIRDLTREDLEALLS